MFNLYSVIKKDGPYKGQKDFYETFRNKREAIKRAKEINGQVYFKRASDYLYDRTTCISLSELIFTAKD